MNNRLATQILFTYQRFECYYMFPFLCMFHLLWKVIYFMKYYIILYYILDFKYREQSSFTGVFVTNYANQYYAIARRNQNVQSQHHKTRFINEKSLRVVRLSSAFRFGTRLVFVVLMLFACGDIELNPSPKKRTSATISQFDIGI